MKKTLLIFSLACCRLIPAQITLTQTDLPVVGTQLIDIADTAVTAVPGNAGANQTWNLTVLKNQRADTLTFISPGSSAYAAMFPGATLATTQRSKEGTNINTFFSFDASGAKTLGLAFTFSTGPYVTKYTPPFRFMKFPSTYGTSIVDSTVSVSAFAYPLPPIDSMKVKSTYHYSGLMDGWGNVITPSGTFPCLRDMEIRHHTDSTFLHTGGSWLLTGTPVSKTDTFFFWYAKNQKFIVAEMQIQEALPRNGSYLNTLLTGISTLAASKDISVYPNPFTESAILKLNVGEKLVYSRFELFDITGRLVKSLVLSPDKTEYVIERGDLYAGLYFYELKNGEEIIKTGRIVVK